MEFMTSVDTDQLMWCRKNLLGRVIDKI